MPIHALSVVDPAADIHPDAIVGPFCVVKGNVSLGPGAELRNHATVYGRTRIGAGTIIFPGAVVGTDPQDLKFRGEDSETIIGQNCRIHEAVTVSKGTASGGMKTEIGDNCLIMAYAHVAHDCIIAEHVVIGNNTQLAGHIKVGRKAIIGGMTGLHHFATIGQLALVGSMSGVRFDVPPFMIAEGNPAEPRNVNQIGMLRDGWSEEHIQAVRDAFRQLYHDRGSKPIAEALAAVRATTPVDDKHPVHLLCSWLEEHLQTSVKGRIGEAHRAPVVGGKAAKPARRETPRASSNPGLQSGGTH
jgi:UDP-N-acetylglucosamine acyltransferase